MRSSRIRRAAPLLLSLALLPALIACTGDAPDTESTSVATLSATEETSVPVADTSDTSAASDTTATSEAPTQPATAPETSAETSAETAPTTESSTEPEIEDTAGAPSEPVTDTTTETETESETEEETTVPEPQAYAIVYPADADDLTMYHVQNLKESLAALGYDAPLMPDSDVPEEASDAWEILIGSTTRPESAAASLPPADEYDISMVGRKILILGGSSYALADATAAFVAGAAVTADGVCFPPVRAHGQATLPDYKILAADQKNSCVSVIDLAYGTIARKESIKNFRLDEYNVADARLRVYDGRTVLVVAYGNTKAKIFDYETKKTLWSTTFTAANPHAAELLPNGVVAVSSSTGVQVRFFLFDGDGDIVATYDLADAHGALYDPDGDLLWVIGKNNLIGLKVTRDGDKVTVEEIPDKKYTIPKSGSHDLQPMYGDPDKLWISTGKALFSFSKSTGQFSTEDAERLGANVTKIKGVATFADGSFAYVVPEGQFRDWTTQSVWLIRAVGDGYETVRISSDTVGFYKIHVANSSYN